MWWRFIIELWQSDFLFAHTQTCFVYVNIYKLHATGMEITAKTFHWINILIFFTVQCCCLCVCVCARWLCLYWMKYETLCIFMNKLSGVSRKKKHINVVHFHVNRTEKWKNVYDIIHQNIKINWITNLLWMV